MSQVIEEEVLEVSLDDETPPEEVDLEADDVEDEDEIEEDEILLGEEVINAPDPEEQKAPRWVKDLRKQHKEAQRKIKELESQLTKAPVIEKVQPLSKKPTLEDFDYDADKFQENLERWFFDKQKHDIEARKADDAQKEYQTAFQKKIDSYNEKKASLKVRDFEDAEQAVMQSLNDIQQNIILQGAENPALLAYAIGKNPKRLAELAKISDHVKFAFEVAKLEKDLKVNTRKPSAQPEKAISGTGRASSGTDSHLEKLRARAEKTGDYSEITQYKLKLRNK